VSQLNFENMSHSLRNEGTCFFVEPLFVLAGGKRFQGRGKLTALDRKVNLHVIPNSSEEPPSVGGIISSEDFWTIGGLVEGQVPIWCRGLPHNWRKMEGSYAIHGSDFGVGKIQHLLPHPNIGKLEVAIFEAAKINAGENVSDEA